MLRWYDAHPWWPQPELWIRHDVGGHPLGCRMLPVELVNGDPSRIACDCYASVWRRWPA